MPHDSDTSLAHNPPAPEAAARHIQQWMDTERRHAASQYGADARRRPAMVGVIGAGVMGAAIAAAAFRRGIPVMVVDKDEQAVATAPPRIASWLTPSAPIAAMPSEVERLVQTGRELAQAARCDFVIESVVEEMAVKQRLLAQLEPLLAPGSIVATNTSTIPLARLSTALRDPGRLCGCHFFLPVGQGARMVEIIHGDKTRPETIAAAVEFAGAIDHLPLVVADAPGFVVNRLLVPYLAEAMQLLTEGVALEAVESAAVEFGMTLGPLRLLDEIGLDVGLECAWTMSGSSSDLVVRSPLLVAMVKAKQLGRKTQAGFFLYDATDPRPRGPNPQLGKALSRWPQEPCVHTPDTILLRLMTPMLLEATRMIQRGSVRDAGQIDLAILFGFGFPASRGGLLYWADHLGAARIVQLLGTLDYLGPRAQPTPLLVEMAQRGGRFFD